MRNVTISVDEKVYEESRKYAKARGISFNALVRELLQRTVQPAEAHTLEHAFELANRLKLGSKGRKWTRADIYVGKRFE